MRQHNPIGQEFAELLCGLGQIPVASIQVSLESKAAQIDGQLQLPQQWKNAGMPKRSALRTWWQIAGAA